MMTKENTTIRKGFSYDAILDQDIEEFFKNAPPKKHSLYMRTAIRLLIQYTGLNDSPVLTPEGIKKLEQKILENKNTEPAPSIKQDASKEDAIRKENN